MKLQKIKTIIYEIRGQEAIFDFDSAELYEMETNRLKESVKTNIERFSASHMFEITKTEFDRLRSQITSSKKVTNN